MEESLERRINHSGWSTAATARPDLHGAPIASPCSRCVKEKEAQVSEWLISANSSTPHR